RRASVDAAGAARGAAEAAARIGSRRPGEAEHRETAARGVVGVEGRRGGRGRGGGGLCVGCVRRSRRRGLRGQPDRSDQEGAEKTHVLSLTHREGYWGAACLIARRCTSSAVTAVTAAVSTSPVLIRITPSSGC